VRSLIAFVTTLTLALSGASAAEAVVTVPQYKKANQQVWRIQTHGGYGGDFHARGGNPKGKQWLGNLRSRAKGPHTRAIMKSMTENRRERWRFVRWVDEVVTPFGESAIPPQIVHCESDWEYEPDDPGDIKGYGLYALIDFENYDSRVHVPKRFRRFVGSLERYYMPKYNGVLKPLVQHLVARQMWVEEGEKPWYASKHCWGSTRTVLLIFSRTKTV
jgi:hypothetical protein